MLKKVIFSLTLLSAFEVHSAGGMVKVAGTPDAKSALLVTNMPKVRSQDSIGLCYAFSASTLFDEAYCNENNTPDCSSQPDNQRSSVLDISRFNNEVASNIMNKRDSYRGISEGGGIAFSLRNLVNGARKVTNEKCAPFDQMVAKMADPVQAQKRELEIWNAFKKSYSDYQKVDKSCVTCGAAFATAVDDLKEKYDLKASNTEILAAFAEDSYEKFLDKLLVPEECWGKSQLLKLKGNWATEVYPNPEQPSDYNAMINKVKEILTKKRPIGISFCDESPLKAKTLSECGKGIANTNVSGGAHGVVIKGYRKVCNTKGACYDALQIQNSWGQGWQNSNDDGWVDAKTLIGRTLKSPHSLTWLENKN